MRIAGDKISFADFLDLAHEHMQHEKVPDEILDAFRASPFLTNNNNITLDSLRHLLCNTGEKLSHREFNTLLRELNINKPEISYQQFVESLVIPRSSKNN